MSLLEGIEEQGREDVNTLWIQISKGQGGIITSAVSILSTECVPKCMLFGSHEILEKPTILKRKLIFALYFLFMVLHLISR